MKYGFVPVITVTLTLFVPGVAGADWDIEVVDAVGDVGLYTSIAFDNLGSPCVSYHDDTNGTLKIACKSGELWATQTVPDGEAPVGDYSSLAIGADGTMHVGYRRGSDVLSVLKYAIKTGSMWQIETVDNQSNGVGNYISLVLDSSGAPHIAHAKRWGSNAMKYAAWTGSSWDNQTIFKTSRGQYLFTDTDIQLDSTDRPRVVFILDFLYLSRKTGSNKWTHEITEGGCGYGSVALAIEGETHHVVYTAGEPCELRYATWSEDDEWMLEAAPIDTAVDDHRAYVSIALEENGNLHVSYYDGFQGALRYAHRPAGGPWGEPEIVDASTGDVGLFTSIALDSSGNPHVSYYDAANGDLRYAVYSTTCAGDVDCDDLNDCTVDACNEGVCTHTPEIDGLTCGGGVGLCCGGSCVIPVCTGDTDCDDGHPCTTDSCIAGNTCSAYCESVPVPCVCEELDDRWSCNADPGCRWNNKKKLCEPV